MDIPGYDPRGSFGMGIAYATSDRGACHQRAWTVRAELDDPELERFSFNKKAGIVKNVQDESYKKSKEIKPGKLPEPLSALEIPSFSVSLKEEEAHFAIITLSLGYKESKKLNIELEKRKKQIRDIIYLLLMEKKFKDLDSVEDTIALAEEIKSTINNILVSGKIIEVYFIEFVVN